MIALRRQALAGEHALELDEVLGRDLPVGDGARAGGEGRALVGEAEVGGVDLRPAEVGAGVEGELLGDRPLATSSRPPLRLSAEVLLGGEQDAAAQVARPRR